MKKLTTVIAITLTTSCGTNAAAKLSEGEEAETKTERRAPSTETETKLPGSPTAPAPKREPLVKDPSLPPGYPQIDPYKTHAEACQKIVDLEVPEERSEWKPAILEWCNHRSWHASRNKRVVSKIDGSQIHDRDRPTAYLFYDRNVKRGTLDPEHCEYHRLEKLDHPPACKKLRDEWPFKSPTMTSKLASRWMKRGHEMEEFGARGPHDWNANAFKYVRGCWHPRHLERFDVGIFGYGGGNKDAVSPDNRGGMACAGDGCFPPDALVLTPFQRQVLLGRDSQAFTAPAWPVLR